MFSAIHSTTKKPLIQYFNRVSIENHSNLPYSNRRNEQLQTGVRRIGDDLSRTDAQGHVDFSRNDKEFTTKSPYPYGHTTTIIAG